MKETFVYLKDDEHTWVPAIQRMPLSGNRAKVARALFSKESDMLQCCGQKQKYAENEIVDLTEYPNKVLPMQNVDQNGRLADYKDMVKLPYMHEVSNHSHQQDFFTL